ncbi:flagellar motor switch phosphatase FliY [Haloimpatiens sp. FM7315]|uniref:flagellar motor switch phosphatase FliY n=1 Tax=Haloimpatiens sp. FM7315 TaxID=3298609 RepID=UPI0035A2A793
MSNDFLSQEEIDSLLNGGNEEATSDNSEDNKEALSDTEKDLLGEIGNISMGSASTALSTILNQTVNITTPQVTTTTLRKLRDTFAVPNICLEVQYTSGIMGENLLVMKVSDAAVIASLMMGGDGSSVESSGSLSEIEESAVAEAMNQMIGSAATSMATMFSREVNISPPKSRIWSDNSEVLAEGIDEDETIIKVAFKLNIGTLVDSEIMQILPINTGKKIVNIMMGNEEPKEEVPEVLNNEPQIETKEEFIKEKPIETKKAPVSKQVEVQKAAFEPLREVAANAALPSNIDLILDVPLQISVVLGRTKMSIKDILNLGTGSLVELDKLAEEPVEILVNGKIVAYGEVVVIDENFGVRLTSIVSSKDRVKSLGK